MAQTLTTNIVINATVGNGFSDIGNTLSQLGAQVDGISEKLINFGKKSINVYEDYEKNMSNARIALATEYGRDTKELDDVMANLEVAATRWSRSTIFHTDDVSNAITEAARAGWDYDKIMQGIPVAMELAQAGSIDLSEALYYITESAKAGGIAFEDLGHFVDLWSFAANSSNGTVESFGDTMLKLGATMRFTDSEEELFSLIALMHDMGESGSTAATLLRTSMMRILAPSGVASSVLEQLGATDDEINAIREDTSKLAALNMLESYGFSAFDSEGQAKPILQIYSELGMVLAEIAGGYENITKNETTLGVLSNIFGTRGITGALNIVTALEHATELQERLTNGEAEGYGQFAASTLMDTYFGDIETWKSKVEDLEKRTGEVLTSQLSPVLETLGGFADQISAMDDGSFNALVAGLEVVAGLGPGLLLAGGAFRFLGNMLALFADPTTGAIAAATLAIAGLSELMVVMNEFEKAEYADQFGDMGLDQSQVNNYVKQLSDDFNAAYTNVNFFRDALDNAVISYTNASSQLKSSLITDMLNDVDVSEGTEEYEKLFNFGNAMIQAVEDGIKANYDATAEAITQTMGGEADAANNPMWQQMMEVLYSNYETELANAREHGENLRKAMFEAFSDGHLTGDEIANLQSIIDEENALLAKQQDRAHYIEQQAILRRAQTLGIDALRESSERVKAELDAEEETLLNEQAGDYWDLADAWDTAIAQGEEVPNTDGTAGFHAATEADKEASLALLAERQQGELYSRTIGGADWIRRLWTEGITSSGLGGAWASLEALGADFRGAGGVVTQAAANAYNESVTGKESEQVTTALLEMVDWLGGIEKVQDYTDYLEGIGDFEKAYDFRSILDMYEAIGGGRGANALAGTAGNVGDYSDVAGTYDQIAKLLADAGTALTPEGLAEYMRTSTEDWGIEPDWFNTLGEDLYNQMAQTAMSAGFGNIGEMISSLDLAGTEADLDSLQTKIDGMAGPDLVATLDTTAVDNYQPTPKYLDIITRMGGAGTVNAQLYADGGRANDASIFAEDGPEWAIPEEHSDRTAELLNAARAASGFTWPDLIARFGGLGANANNTPHTLVYSPTIYAQNAEGVEQTLAADKARLDRWYAEKQMMDSVEVYA